MIFFYIRILIVILVFSLFLSCIKESERIKDENKFINYIPDFPCWIINPPEKCPKYKNNKNYDFFISSLETTEKSYNSQVENDLKLKLATELFSSVACKIENEHTRFVECKFIDGIIQCKTNTMRVVCIETYGRIGLGLFHIEEIFWNKKKNNCWIVYVIGKISRKYTNSVFFYNE